MTAKNATRPIALLLLLAIAVACSILITPDSAPVTHSLPNPQIHQSPAFFKKIAIESHFLTDFWGKETRIRTALFIPSQEIGQMKRPTPVFYHFLGFGEGLGSVDRYTEMLQSAVDRNPPLAAAQVFVDASISGGYSYFVNSPNNGPWESALIDEIIPQVEQRLGDEIKVGARFITGHSSGGWVAVRLMLQYPDLFSGVWSTAPDPLTFDDFFGINLAPGSADNVYTQNDGKPRPAAAFGEWSGHSLMEYIVSDEADSTIRGDFQSYEWAFSSKADNGRPVELFERKSGLLNQTALSDWQRFDLLKQFLALPEDRKKKLAARIHLVVGEKDDYFLDRPTRRFCDTLVGVGVPAACLFVPERGHRNLYDPEPQLYPTGLMARILSEASVSETR